MKIKENLSTINILFLFALIGTISFSILLSLDKFQEHTAISTIENIEDAIYKALIQCYALEGAYPPDLQYLADHYGIVLNEDEYIYHYEVTIFRPNVIVFKR